MHPVASSDVVGVVSGGRVVARGGVFSPCGTLLVLPHGPALRVVAAATAAPVATLASARAPVSAISPVGESNAGLFVSSGLDGTLRLWSWGAGGNPPKLRATFDLGAPIERVVGLGGGGGGEYAGRFV